MKTIHKWMGAIAVVSLASGTSFASAEDTNGFSHPNADASATSSRAAESSSSRWGSPAVDRSARPADPIPAATTRADKSKRFAAEEAEWQRLSTP